MSIVANKRLYVGGLNYAVDDASLEDLFSSVGKVSFAKVIRDFHSGRSKGFGFVEMSSSQEASEAIDKLHGSTHEGRVITVSEANPPESNANRSGGYNRRRGGGQGGMGGGAGGGGYRRRDTRDQEEQY